MDDLTNGGSAFPRKELYSQSPGMTLRDWFAGQIISGICANGNISRDMASYNLFGEVAHKIYSDSAYKLADEMLRRRTEN